MFENSFTKDLCFYGGDDQQALEQGVLDQENWDEGFAGEKCKNLTSLGDSGYETKS